jgi:hypothetical protein
MMVSGNAWQWWYKAAGTYARGRVPELGSVLAFRNNMRMPMGHVAVVGSVESSRVITVDHSNWPVGDYRGAVSRGVAVVDVSERNDWTAVRVALGRGDDFGSIYPTHGFIYNRPDHGIIRVAGRAPSPVLPLYPPPRDLRLGVDQVRTDHADRVFEEVAEAPPVAASRRSDSIASAGPVAPSSITVLVFNGGN